MRALAFLAAARLAIRLLPLEIYRGSLGAMRAGAGLSSELADGTLPTTTQQYWARRVERAALRLPGENKCFAKAVALHWLLRWEGDEGTLVVAIHLHERSAHHAYHAWLECGGAMLVGACDRTEYRELMRFTFGEASRPVLQGEAV